MGTGPTNLWFQADREASEKFPGDDLAPFRHAWRIARYNELMISHGHVIIDKTSQN